MASTSEADDHSIYATLEQVQNDEKHSEFPPRYNSLMRKPPSPNCPDDGMEKKDTIYCISSGSPQTVTEKQAATHHANKSCVVKAAVLLNLLLVLIIGALVIILLLVVCKLRAVQQIECEDKVIDPVTPDANPINFASSCVSVMPTLVNTAGCGSQIITVDSLGGYIVTPNYPNLYPPNVTCEWIFRPNYINRKITFEIVDFSLESHFVCAWDHLASERRDEPFSSFSFMDGTRMSRLCFESNVRGVTFDVYPEWTQHCPVLKFRSDVLVQKRGFKIRYWLK